MPQDDPSIPLREPSEWPLGTALIAFALVLTVLAPLVVGGGGVTMYLQGPVLPVLLVGAVMVGVHLRSGRPWTFLAAGIAVSLLPIMILAMFGTSQLTDPLLRWEFPANVMLFAALLLALPGGALGALRARGEPAHPRLRGALGHPQAVGSLLVAGMAVGAIVAGAFAASGAADLRAAAGTGYDIEPDRTIEVMMRNDLFHPSTIEVPAGELVEVHVVNEDDAFHTFTYERGGTTWNHDVHGSETLTFLTTFEDPGTVPLWCEPHEPHMVGEIQVSDGGSA